METYWRPRPFEASERNKGQPFPHMDTGEGVWRHEAYMDPGAQGKVPSEKAVRRMEWKEVETGRVSAGCIGVGAAGGITKNIGFSHNFAYTLAGTD